MSEGQIGKMYKEHKEPILYVFFGGFTTLISLVTYMAFVWMGLDLNVSNILSWVCGVLFAFVSNKWFVFSSRSTEKTTVMRELGSFVGARVFTGILAAILFPILLAVGLDGEFMGTDGFLARIVTSVIEIILNWIFSKYLVFVKKADNNPDDV
jgi:Predicted membrane protein